MKYKICTVLQHGTVKGVEYQHCSHSPAYGFTNLRVKYMGTWFDVLTDPVFGGDLHILYNGEKLPVLMNFMIRAGFSRGERR